MADADAVLAEILKAALASDGSEETGQEYRELHGFAAFENLDFILVDPEKVIFKHIEVEYLALAGFSDRSSRSISASGRTEKHAKKL